MGFNRLATYQSGEETTYRYDAFGTPLLVVGNADNSITYAGYQYDAESGLYYLNARHYDSQVARFLTEDIYAGQADDPLSLNRYTYCANNPLRYTDPSGHFFGALLRFIGGAVIGGGIEYITQKFIEKREEVDWKAVAYEAAVGGVGAVVGGVLGKAGGSIAETAMKTGKSAAKVAVERVVAAGVSEAVQGALEDAGRQVIVDGKRLDNLDFGQLFQTMGIAGIGGVFGAAADFISDYRRNARVKRVPVMVEVEEVHYECLNHIKDCKIHENNIRVVTKEKKWEIREVLEYNGTDRSFMDYLGEQANDRNVIGYRKNNADPMRDVLGSGRISSPDEWDSIIKELKKNGVEIKYREGVMAYAPDPGEAGKQGQLLIDPDASLSALKHEYQHFLDAKAEGSNDGRSI